MTTGLTPVARITGLRALDERELREALSGIDARFDKEDTDSQVGKSYEPVTIAMTILLTAAALKGLSAWLLKKRHRKHVEFEVEVKRPDGSYERKRCVVDMSESTSQVEVVRTVGEQFGIDATILAEAIKLAT